MIVGVFYFELFIPACRSRKGKRMIINSLKKRLRNGHNIAVSDVAFQEQLQRCGLGMSTVSLRRSDAEKLFDAIYNQICQVYDVEIIQAEKDFL